MNPSKSKGVGVRGILILAILALVATALTSASASAAPAVPASTSSTSCGFNVGSLGVRVTADISAGGGFASAHIWIRNYTQGGITLSTVRAMDQDSVYHGPGGSIGPGGRWQWTTPQLNENTGLFVVRAYATKNRKLRGGCTLYI